ncbi:hypothetical protein GS982_19815 [Rhodococcus hoagii]|nr:hypothetical protein [Prescottella equi]
MPYQGTLVGPVLYFRGQRSPSTAAHRRTPPATRAGTNCTSHHLACDCREAEQNEALNETRSEWRTLRAVLEAQLAGHPTEVYVDGDAEPTRLQVPALRVRPHRPCRPVREPARPLVPPPLLPCKDAAMTETHPASSPADGDPRPLAR